MSGTITEFFKIVVESVIAITLYLVSSNDSNSQPTREGLVLPVRVWTSDVKQKPSFLHSAAVSFSRSPSIFVGKVIEYSISTVFPATLYDEDQLLR